jgi:hypothetical protein
MVDRFKVTTKTSDILQVPAILNYTEILSTNLPQVNHPTIDECQDSTQHKYHLGHI